MTSRTVDFHFAPFRYGDKIEVAVARHEHYLFSKLQLKPGMRVLEVGCHSGAVALELANFADVNVTGVDSDPTKIEEANHMASILSMSNALTFVSCDLTRLCDHFPQGIFDAIYSIESLRFMSSFDTMYTQFHYLLKPGGRLATYEWCWTNRLEPWNQDHQRLVELVEDATNIGRRQPDQRSMLSAVTALRRADFHVLEYGDLADDLTHSKDGALDWFSPIEAAIGGSEIPWNSPGQPSRLFDGLTKDGAMALLYAGQFKLFTPMAIFVGQRF